jgi:preprotein translocase subunit SecE
MIARMATTPITFFGEVRDELKKVVWPTRQETTRLTLVVITVSLLVGLFLGGLDFIFVKLIGIIVK